MTDDAELIADLRGAPSGAIARALCLQAAARITELRDALEQDHQTLNALVSREIDLEAAEARATAAEAREAKLSAAVLAYDAAIRGCANEPERMASFCTAEGDDLDTLYLAMIQAASLQQVATP